MGTKKREQTTNVAIRKSLYADFVSFCTDRKIGLREAAGALFEWMMRQPPPVQSAVMGIKDKMQASYAKVLEEMAAQLRAENPPYNVKIILLDDSIPAIPERDAPANADQSHSPGTAKDQPASKAKQKNSRGPASQAS